MPLRASLRTLLIAALPLLLALGCKQEEGEPCDVDDDCGSGLICCGMLTTSGRGYCIDEDTVDPSCDIPEDGGMPDAGEVEDEDAGTATDAGPDDEDAGTDAGRDDAGTDAGTDAGPDEDAGTDAG